MHSTLPLPHELSLQQLSIGNKEYLFGGIQATLSGGNLVGLFGRNGIGKSTLLRTIAGLQPAFGGEIRLGTQNLSQYKPAQLARLLSFVPSQTLRQPKLSVADMVGLGRYNFTNWIGKLGQEDEQAISQALALTGLTALAQQEAASLSDGELQRAAIARSLVQDTALILLDEPTAFLDMANKFKVVQLLKKLSREQGKGILFSSHDLSLALQVCDQLWIMDDSGFYANTPAQLIAQGVFTNLFADDGLVFDASALTYKIGS